VSRAPSADLLASSLSKAAVPTLVQMFFPFPPLIPCPYSLPTPPGQRAVRSGRWPAARERRSLPPALAMTASAAAAAADSGVAGLIARMVASRTDSRWEEI
jgi:hypothetical protein